MFVATQHGAGEPAPSGYAQLPPSMMQQMGLPIMVPPEVVMAMRFVDMCNSYQRPMQYYEMDDGEPIASGIHVSDLHPFQDAAMRRACILLGRYFDGNGPRRAK